MTPGITLAKNAGIAHTIHEYAHDPKHASYGLEAAEKMGVPAAQVFKTLVVELDTKELVVGIVQVSTTLNMKAIARAAGAKRAAMADAGRVQRTTGYILGGVSPLGQKKLLRTFIDDTAQQFGTVFVSAGKRGLEIELNPHDLARLIRASFAGIAESGF